MTTFISYLKLGKSSKNLVSNALSFSLKFFILFNNLLVQRPQRNRQILPRESWKKLHIVSTKDMSLSIRKQHFVRAHS